MTKEAEIALVAAKLTKAQREAVVFIGNGPYDNAISLFATFWNRPENKGLLQVIRHDLGLTTTILADTGCGPIERLTDRGKALKAHLERAQGEDSTDV